MADVWKTAISGDWTNSADWSTGAPKVHKDAIINEVGAYTVAISSADIAHSLTLDAAGATLQENSGGSLTMAGALTLDDGTVILNGTNNFGGGITLGGGTLELGNAAALGTSGLTFDGGTLVGTVNIALSGPIAVNETVTLAAARYSGIWLTGQTIFYANVIEFGQTGDNGVVIWAPLTLDVADKGFAVDVNDGTLLDGSGSLSELLSAAGSVNVAAGAKLDVHGQADTIGNSTGDGLTGGGVVTSTVGGGALTLDGSSFAGTITGSLALTVSDTVTLTNISTYTGGTTIDQNAVLRLSGSGAVGGNIADNGTLDIDRSNLGGLPFNGEISGTGSVRLDAGVVALNGTNTYSGGTVVNGGYLVIGNAAAIGSGGISMTHGTLIGTANEAISNQLTMNATAHFAAAHGTTLTLNTEAAWLFSGPYLPLIFGSSQNNGVVVWDSPAGSDVQNGSTEGIVIAGGTLRAGDNNFQVLLKQPLGTNRATLVNQGATLDVAGFANTIYNLRGAGTVENSGALTTVTVDGGNFSGAFVGPITLDIGGKGNNSTPRVDTTFSGAAAEYGTINLVTGATLTIASASASSIVFSSSAHAFLSFADPTEFTGSVSGLDHTDGLMFPTLGDGALSVSYNGDTTGGTLTVTSNLGSVSVALVGDFTQGTFATNGLPNSRFVQFTLTPTASIATAPADSFNFSAATTSHAAAEASVTHLHGSAAEIAFAHDVTEAMHVHDAMLDIFDHGLFAHHAMPEALS